MTFVGRPDIFCGVVPLVVLQRCGHILPLPAGAGLRAGVQSVANIVCGHPSHVRKVTNAPSAELEMTVNILIQIDKLVQLLESPVFTCMSASLSRFTSADNLNRLETPTSRARTIPTSIQVPLRPSDAPPAVLGLCRPQEPPKQCQLDWLPAHCPKAVGVPLFFRCQFFWRLV